jgi:enterochelin esterase-like enzyme
MSRLHQLAVTALFITSTICVASAQEPSKAKKKQQQETAAFKWVNELPANRLGPLKHDTFHSKKHDCQVGYFIYLPPAYHQPENANKRFPVVYYLHGGRPGGEQKGIQMMKFIQPAIESGRISPMIYVFVNGGEMSHYDFPAKQSYGETAFVKELIPHIDATYRTIASREGRGLEGFSQGGRGTGRIMFKYPELFSSCAPLGGGQQHEKHASENDGRETSGVQFDPGNNTFDLARDYVKNRMQQFPLKVLVAVGKNDFNYEGNLEWSALLKSLGIEHEFHVAGDAEHSAVKCYEELGDTVMKFHADNFERVSSR